MLQIFNPILTFGEKIKLPPLLNLILVFAVFFSVCYLAIVSAATQAAEFDRIYTIYRPKLIEMALTVLAALQIPPESLSAVDWLDVLRRHVLGISETIFALFDQIFLIIVFFSFMLLEGPYLRNKIDIAFPGFANAKIKNIMSSITSQTSSYLGTLTLVGLAGGFCVWAVLALVGVELAIVWGVLAFLLNYIPNVGAIIATALPVMMAVLQFSPDFLWPAIVLVLVSAIQFVTGNIMAPKMLGDKLGLSPVVIMISYGYALDSTKVNFYNTCPYERIPYDF